jgi:hypothetical protein
MVRLESPEAPPRFLEGDNECDKLLTKTVEILSFNVRRWVRVG